MKILITGASRGIGLAEAMKLDKNGNKLFLTATSTDSFNNSNFKNAELFGCDLKNQDEVIKLSNRIKSVTDRLDVLINNVGIMIMKRFEDMSNDDINIMLDLNLRSHLLLTKEILTLLKKSENPHIIFMSSMGAKTSIIGESVYSATKGAIANFASVLRNEMGSKIKVSTIHSWGVNTWDSNQPDILLKPENIAELVEFIILRDKLFLIESIEVSNIHQWRGGKAPWSPR